MYILTGFKLILIFLLKEVSGKKKSALNPRMRILSEIKMKIRKQEIC